MRFKPKGGLNPAQQKTDRDAVEARQDVVTEQGGQERLFEKRHLNEIERAENVAAGLPPEGKPEIAAPAAPAEHAQEQVELTGTVRKCSGRVLLNARSVGAPFA